MGTVEDSAYGETPDEFAAALRARRIEAGSPSYAEVAARIARRREDAGVPSAAAQVARSSVYDAFRDGRRRLNADLVEEIVIALGADATEAQLWRRRCLLVGQPVPAPADRSAQPAAPVAWSFSGTGPVRQLRAPGVDLPMSARMSAAPEFAAVLMVAAIAVNVVGGVLASRFESVLFFDTIGTAAAALLLGPWRAAVVGAISNAVASIITFPETIVFGFINAIAGMMWGFGARWWRADRNLGRFLLLTIFVAVVCTLFAVPLNILLYGGQLLHSGDGMYPAGDAVLGVVAGLNLRVSIVDKLISAAVAYGAAVVVLRLRSQRTPRVR